MIVCDVLARDGGKGVRTLYVCHVTAMATNSTQSPLQARKQRANARNRPDQWMGKLTRDPKTERDADSALRSRTGKRATDQGLLSITLDDYLKLVKWTARSLRTGQRKTIPKNLDRTPATNSG